MLRAGYFGQELLSTFGTSIGEIALIPATGGKFTVDLTYRDSGSLNESPDDVKNVLIWDRKAEGGFPETKILKQRVRNHIEPGKNLGHSDTPASKVAGNDESRSKQENVVSSGAVANSTGTPADSQNAMVPNTMEDCEDCK